MLRQSLISQVVFVCLGIGLAVCRVNAASERTVLDLWPNGTSGATTDIGLEREIKRDPPDGVVRLTDVSRPQITVYRPKQPNGAAVLVCPGGGYKILAYEHEGTKVCDFFNQHGVTAILLKYRVPAPRDLPLQDAQRAIGLIHDHADEWGIDRRRIGMLGFSAGGHLTLMTPGVPAAVPCWRWNTRSTRSPARFISTPRVATALE